MKRLILGIFLLVMQPVMAGELIIEAAWARATVPGMPMGAVYMRMINPAADPVQIDEIRTEVARQGEIHESIEIDGMMRMRHVNPFIVNAGDTEKLEPGGRHIMLMGLVNPLKEGARFKLNLVDTQGDSHQVDVIVGGFGQMEMPR